MNDCFLKQYKRSIENSNLPKLDMIVLDYLNVGNPKAFLIRSGVNATYLKFKFNVHDGSATGSLVSEATVAAGQTRIFYFDASTPATESMVEIDNVYDIKLLTGYDACLSFNPTLKTGLQSIFYNDNMLWTGGMGMDMSLVPENLVRLSVDRENVNDIINMDEIFARNVIQIVNRSNPFIYASGAFLELTNVTRANTSIKAIGLRPKGSIVDIPINTVCLYVPTSECSGNIEDFIARARNAGRTTGSIMFKQKNDWHVSYNGAWLRELPAEITSPMFSWDANTISLITTATQDITTVDTNYRAQYAWQPLTQ